MESSQPKGQGKGKSKSEGKIPVGVKIPQHVRQPKRSAHVAIRTQCGGGGSKITRLQSALAFLGEDDGLERSAFEGCIERAKKRVVVAEEYVQWAQEWKVECEKELSEAEERLSRLRLKAERPMAPVPDPPTEVQRLQQPVCGGASSTSPARFRINGGSSQTPA